MGGLSVQGSGGLRRSDIAAAMPVRGGVCRSTPPLDNDYYIAPVSIDWGYFR